MNGNNTIWMTWRGVNGDQRIWGALAQVTIGAHGLWDAPGVLGAGAFNSSHAPSLYDGSPGRPPAQMVWKGVDGDEAMYGAALPQAGRMTGTRIVGPSGPFQTVDRPSAVVDGGGRTVLAWRDGSNAIRWSVRAPNAAWGAAAATGASSAQAPVLMAVSGTVELLWVGLDRRLNSARLTGNAFTPQAPLPGTAVSSAAPAVAHVSDNQLLAVWKHRDDNSIRLASFSGGWSQPAPVVPVRGAALTDASPAIAVTGRTGPIIAWKGIGAQQIWSSTMRGGKWTEPAVIDPGINSATGPALLGFGGSVPID
jgi:hypothetical protein